MVFGRSNLELKEGDHMDRAKRQWAEPRGDAGLTLVEIVVSLVVFAIMASGIVAGAITVTRMSADNRAREIATHLASQDLDAVRLIGNPFNVHNTTYSPPSNPGFTVTRATSWVSSTGSDVGCGSSVNLQYRRVDVAVTWAGKLGTTLPVRSDVIIAPNGPISDPTTGTILVSVKNRNGNGQSGVGVTITPASAPAGNTAVALPSQPLPTDSDGCTIAMTVTPGAYTVTLGQTSYLSSLSATTAQSMVNAPVVPVSVAAGSTASASFVYDQAATFPVTYAANYLPPRPGQAPALPPSLNTTLLPSASDSGGLNYVSTNAPSSIQLFPYSNGWTPIAGKLGGPDTPSMCRSVDPSAWPAGTANGKAVTAGVRSPAVVAAPGATSTTPLTVQMGVVVIASTAALYVTATPAAAPAGSGDPGCPAATNSTYAFGQVASNGTSVVIALPYGSWTISTGAAASPLMPATASSLSAPTNAAGGGVATGGVVTLDPRPLR